jgi:hypothetical protein
MRPRALLGFNYTKLDLAMEGSVEGRVVKEALRLCQAGYSSRYGQGVAGRWSSRRTAPGLAEYIEGARPAIIYDGKLAIPG